MVKYKISYDSDGGGLKYNFTYGELTKEGLIDLLKNYDTNEKTFYDLGSGKGNVLIYASEEFNNLKNIIGIELDQNRHTEACKNIKKNKKEDKITVINDDILSNKFNYGDADFIYISNLCFPEDVNEALSKKLNSEVKNGAVIFSSKFLDFKGNSECSKTKVKQTWIESSNIFINFIKKMNN